MNIFQRRNAKDGSWSHNQCWSHMNVIILSKLTDKLSKRTISSISGKKNYYCSIR